MKTPLLTNFSLACVCQAQAAWSLTDGNSIMQGVKTLRRVEAHENLTADETVVASKTAAYLRGFLDSSTAWSKVEQNSLFKLPEHGITVAEFLPAIEKFLTKSADKPQVLELPAGGLLLAVLVEYFPNPALKNDTAGSRALDEQLNDNWLRR